MTQVSVHRVAVVTGASSGIGKEVAKALAAQGWRIVALGRDTTRCAAADEEIRAASAGGDVEMIVADLALLADAARAAREIAAKTDSVALLFNNAGGMAKEQVVTAEGHEANFVGNHLGPFLLTQRLMPLLRAAASRSAPGAVRIINTSSDASEMIPGMDWSDLQGLKQFNSGLAYCRAKLANVLFTRGLAKRLTGSGIVAHAAHPGTIDSNFSSHADAATQARLRLYSKLTPAQGADTLLWLATADEPGNCSGGYYHNRQPRTPNAFADEPNADRLWAASEQLIASIGG